MRKVLLIIGAVLALIVLGVGGYLVLSTNESGVPLTARLDPRQLELRDWMAKVIEEDPRNKGVEISVYYEGLNAEVLVFDMQKLSGENSRADVFRVFLQFAQKAKNKKYKEVHLSYRGQHRFTLGGADFQTIGEEHETQNPVYVIRTFPEKLKRPDGTDAFPTWEGGILGVASKQMEDFNTFHDQWYLDDLLRESN